MDSIEEYETIKTNEIKFYGQEAQNILKLYKEQELSSNSSLQLYEKASKFFWVNFKIFYFLKDFSSLTKERMIIGT